MPSRTGPSTSPASQPPGEHWRSLSRGAVLGLLLILGLAAGLRLYAINASSFWLDEFCSVETSTGRGLAHVALPTNVFMPSPGSLTTLTAATPWWSIWTSMRLDNHPPLYFILLRFWRDVFGQSDTAARTLSVVPSLAAIVLLFDAVLVSTRRTSVALWSAALMAVAMPQVHFAQEARGYSLLVATELAACAALVRCQCLGFSRRRALALGASVLAMLLTHYYAIAPAAALGIYALCRLRGPARIKSIAALGAGAVVFAVVWGPFLWQQRTGVAVNNSWQIDNVPDHLWSTAQRIAVLPLRLLSETLAGRSPQTDNYWPIAWIAAVLYVAPLLLLRRRPDLLLWYLIFIIPVCLVAAVDLADDRRQTAIIRYTQMAGPGLYVLIAAAFSEAPARYRHLLPGAMCLACFLTLFTAGAYSEDMDSRLLADAIGPDAQSGVPVVFASAGHPDWYAGALYLMASHYTDIRGPIMLLSHPAPPDWEEALRSAPPSRLWLVAGSKTDQPDQLLPGITFKDTPDTHLYLPNLAADVWIVDLSQPSKP